MTKEQAQQQPRESWRQLGVAVERGVDAVGRPTVLVEFPSGHRYWYDYSRVVVTPARSRVWMRV